MKNNRKFVSLVLVAILVLSTFTTAFAADRDLKHKETEETHEFPTYVFDNEFYSDLVFGGKLGEYYVEVDEDWYELDAVQAKFDDNPEITLEDAIEGLEPVEDVEDPKDPEEPVGELKVVDISAIDSTKLKVEFNQKVDKTSAELLTNYYIGIGDNDVVNSSIHANNNTAGVGHYEATLQEDGKTVIITAKDGDVNKYVIWEDKYTNESVVFTNAKPLVVEDNGGTGDIVVVKNKEVTVQVRNVRDANGKLMSTDEGTFMSVDNTPAKPVENEIFVKLESGDDVNVEFNEPVFYDSTEDDVEFYLNSKNITDHVNYDSTDDTKSTLTIDGTAAKLDDLKKGKHTFRIVGLEDLAGNKASNDIYSITLNVDIEEDEETDEDKPEASVEQISEFELKVTFAAQPKSDTKIKVQDSDGNTLEEGVDVDTNTGSVSGTTSIIKFKGKKDDVYKNSTSVYYTVQITGEDGGKIVNNTDHDVKADAFNERIRLDQDLLAPKVDMDKFVDEYDFDDNIDSITIPFIDAPFKGGVLIGNDLDDVKDIILKQEIDGETKTGKITVGDGANGLNTSEITDELDPDSQLVLDFSNLNDLLDSGKLPEGKYTLTLPRGLVRDSEHGEYDSKRIEDNDRTIPFVGATLEFEIVKDADEEGESVPQTAQNLVKYDDSHDAIVVRFLGDDIDKDSAKNPANYKLSGKEVKVKAVEYETLKEVKAFDSDGIETGNNLGKGAEVRLFLDNDTVELDGSYTLVVSGVRTEKDKAVMKTVSVTLKGMKDNTRPVLEKVTVTGNGRLEMKFSETVDVENDILAAGNFEVLVNGTKSGVALVKEGSSSDMLILELNDSSIDLDEYTVIVITTEDINGDFFVRDLAGNELKVDVEVTAE